LLDELILFGELESEEKQETNSHPLKKGDNILNKEDIKERPKDKIDIKLKFLEISQNDFVILHKSKDNKSICHYVE
jgi:hypothetical protein